MSAVRRAVEVGGGLLVSAGIGLTVLTVLVGLALAIATLLDAAVP